ncbi:MAG TPA: RNA polymerase sigma factor [Streptosporangiaceae bacterium]|jgi:RNA polymerase sigma-70 factor (ECF subfamily)
MTSTHPGRHADAASSQRDDARDIELSLRDPARFGVIFDRYFAEIYGYAAKRAGRDVADDIAAETFLTAFWARPRFDPGRGTVKAWLYGIATNQLSAYRRRELRAYRAMARSGLSPPDEGHADRVVEQVAAGSLRGPLAKALADLSRGEREVLLLVALGDLSNTDVAAALGVPYGTVASRLSRARTKLRKATGIALALDQEEQQ